MASILRFFNRLLPFATPGTPLIQDVAHLVILCALLYFAPQIQQRFQSRAGRGEHEDRQAAPAVPETIHGPAAPDRAPEPDIGDRDEHQPILQEDADDVEQAPDQRNMDPADMRGPGPAHETPRPQNVGAKKAKSLARKDQRRAYHEFQRSQGDAQRARDAEGAETREKALAAERERRRQAESQLEARNAAERDAKRSREEAAREETARRVDFVLATVTDELDTRRACDLFRIARLVGDDVDEEWIEQVLRTSGMIGKKGETMTIITEMGWAVQVNGEDIKSLYKAAIAADLGDDHGKISNETLGKLLEEQLRETSSYSNGI